MMLILFALMVSLAAGVAVFRWRLGLYTLIVVALVQDPLRKLIPGAPGYLVLATLPIWGGIMIGAFREGDLSWTRFKEEYPGLANMLFLYAVGLIFPAIQSATYSEGSWQLTLLGGYTQFAIIGGLILGAHFPLHQHDLERLLGWYCILAGVAMIGAPLERWGIGTSSGLTGTSSLGAYWVTYRTGAALKMLSGFFRSPDIMGWHAVTLVMFGVILAIRGQGWRRIGWAALAGWGGVALMFCARRKMIAMMIPYAIVLAVLLVVYKRARSVIAVALCGAAALAVWSYAYRIVGSDAELEEFYGTTLNETVEHMEVHGIDAVVTTIKQSGFLGYGLGMAAQGTHHIRCERPRIWQESGPSMLVAELGVPGLILFIGVLGVALKYVWSALGFAATGPLHTVYFGLAAMCVANGVAGVVSAQVFGDPFIGLFLPFSVGLILSASRLQGNTTVGVESPRG